MKKALHLLDIRHYLIENLHTLIQHPSLTPICCHATTQLALNKQLTITSSLNRSIDNCGSWQGTRIPPAALHCQSLASMQSIFDFIATQPEIVVNKIYGSSDRENVSAPWACKAIFSSLSALSKNYVFRCLSIHEPLGRTEMEKWVRPELRHLHLKAVDELIKLRILIEIQPEDDAMSRLQMNSFFRRGFQYALCNPIEPWHNTSASQMLKEDKIAPSKEELDEHCSEKWNDVLRVILNIQSAHATSDSTIENFLKCTGLVLENSKRSHEITSDGYEYLLKDHQSQVSFFSNL
jgi:Transcription factor Tfb2